MKDPHDALGRQLAVVYPHPVSVLIGSVPGLIMAFTMWSNHGLEDIPLLFHPEEEAAPGVRIFLFLWLAVTVLLLWMGLRHCFDRAQLCRDGFRFRGKCYLFDEIGPITWSRYSSSGMTRFWDCTVMDFTHRGKPVRLKTRYLQELSYQFHRVYGADGRDGASLARAACTESIHYPR